MTTFAYWVLLVFVAYFAVLIGISVFRARHMDDMSDYVLGGRRMGTFTSALSAASSSSSGWTMLVFPALAFSAGLIHLWTAASIAFGAWLVWTVMGKRLRRYTIATDDSLTLPEFFEKRFLDRTGTLRTLSRGHHRVLHRLLRQLRPDCRGEAPRGSVRHHPRGVPLAAGLWSIQPATPGFLIATPAAVLVTLLTPPPDREMVDLFDRVNGPAAARPEEIR